MAEGHGRDEWGRLSVLLALTANCHRDPKKGRALKPSDYDPWTVDMTERIIMIDRDNVGLLREAFETKG